MEQALNVTWDPTTILLSFAVSVLGSFAAVSLCEQFRLIQVNLERSPRSIMNPRLILILMAIAIGGVAIWSMHFIGMGAVKLTDSNGNHVPFSYDVGLTLVSLIAPIVCVYIGLLIVTIGDKFYSLDKADALDVLVKDAAKSGSKISTKSSAKLFALLSGIHWLALAGVMTATGVCVMHYVGMVSMQFGGRMEWDVGILTLSVIIAIVVSIVAFWILFRFLAMYPHREVFRLISAIIMGLAVNSMHYTGMNAAKYYYTPGQTVSSANISSSMAMDVSLVLGVGVSWILMVVAMRDARAWFYHASVMLSKTDEIMAKAAVNPKEAVEKFATKYHEMRHRSSDKASMQSKTLDKMGAKRSNASNDVVPFDSNISEQQEVGGSKLFKKASSSGLNPGNVQQIKVAPTKIPQLTSFQEGADERSERV